MLLITRPEPDGSRSGLALNKLGFSCLIEPMMRIEPNADVSLDSEGTQAFLVTSANGARAFAKATDLRNVKVFAVGSATAEALREAGFSQVRQAGGDVQSMAGQVIRECDPAAGRLVQIAASQQAGDLSGLLKVAGFDCDKIVLYSTLAATELSTGLINKLENGEISGVLFYSPRTAAIFTGLIEGAAVGNLLKSVTAWCLSKAVSEKLDGQKWQAVRVAGRPDQPTLFALLSQSQAAPAKQKPPQTKPLDDASVLAGEKRVPTKKSEPAETAIPILDKPIGRKTEKALAAARKKSSLGTILTLLIVMFFAGIAAWPLFYPMVRNYLPAYVGDIVAGRFGQMDRGEMTTGSADNQKLRQQIVGLTTQIAQIEMDLEDKISTLAAVRDSGTLPVAELETLVNDRVAAIDAQLGNLRNGITTSQTDMAARIDRQSEKLNQLAARLQTPTDSRTDAVPETAPVPAPVDLSPAIGDLNSRIDVLAGEIAQTLQQLKQTEQTAAEGLAAQSERLQAYDARLRALSDRPANGESAALVLGLERLRREVEEGNGYGDSLALFKLSPSEPMLVPVETLAIYESKGIATSDRLDKDFLQLADRLVHEDRLPDDDSWIGKTLSTIAASVKFRQTGEVAGNSTQAIVARAEVRLQAADLVGAVAELGKLDGKPATIAKDWVLEARSRLAALRALEALNAIVTDMALQSLQKME